MLIVLYLLLASQSPIICKYLFSSCSWPFDYEYVGVLQWSDYSAFKVDITRKINKQGLNISYSHFLIEKKALADHLKQDAIHSSLMTYKQTLHFLRHKDFIISVNLYYHSWKWVLIRYVSSLRTDINQENIPTCLSQSLPQCKFKTCQKIWLVNALHQSWPYTTWIWWVTRTNHGQGMVCHSLPNSA